MAELALLLVSLPFENTNVVKPVSDPTCALLGMPFHMPSKQSNLQHIFNFIQMIWHEVKQIREQHSGQFGKQLAVAEGIAKL